MSDSTSGIKLPAGYSKGGKAATGQAAALLWVSDKVVVCLVWRSHGGSNAGSVPALPVGGPRSL